MRLSLASTSMFIVHRTTRSNRSKGFARYDVDTRKCCAFRSMLSSNSQFSGRFGLFLNIPFYVKMIELSLYFQTFKILF